jgi:hypothetical protein
MKKIILSVICAVVGLYFVFSGYTKLVSTEVLEYTLVNSFNISWGLAPVAARFIIGIEFLLGSFLCLQLWLKKFTLKSMLLLMALFTAYILYSLVSGNNESCNCLGDFIQLTPAQSLLKNAVIIFLLIITYLLAPDRKNKLENKYAAGILIVVSLALPFILFPVESASQEKYADAENHVLQLDSLYTNSDKAQIPAVDFRKGKHIVAFLSLTCPHCRKAALKLSTIYKINPTLPLYFILNGKEKNLEDFHSFSRSAKVPQSFLHGRNFVILAGLELPRIMLIENGVEKATIEYPDLNQQMLEEWANGK